jgi:hypothetical protein
MQDVIITNDKPASQTIDYNEHKLNKSNDQILSAYKLNKLKETSINDLN